MNSFFWLVKINISGFLNGFKQKNKKSKFPAILLVLALAAAIFEVQFFFIAFSTAQVLAQNLSDMSILLQTATSFATLSILFINMYKVPGYLFASKDHDLLFSLPLKPTTIILSKISSVYLSSLLLSAGLIAPFAVAYAMTTGQGILFYLFALAGVLFIPLIPLLIATLLGFLIARIASRFKRSNVATIITSFAAILLIMGFSMFMGYSSRDPQYLLEANPVFNTLSYINITAYFYILALKDISFLNLLLTIVVSAGLFAFVIYFLPKNYIKINSKLTQRHKASAYVHKTLKVSGQFKTLLRKELSMYFSSFLYVMNSAMGLVLFAIVTVILVFNAGMVGEFASLNISLGMAPMVMGFLFLGLSCTTSCAISIEGKRLWQIKCMPIHTKHILLSKLCVNLMISAPFIVVCNIVIGFVLKTTPLEIFAAIVIHCLFATLIALVGLNVNLAKPRLDWKSETEAIKQSASVSITLGIGFLAVAAFVFIVIALSFFPWAYILLSLILLLILDFLLYKRLNKRGVAQFMQLSA